MPSSAVSPPGGTGPSPGSAADLPRFRLHALHTSFADAERAARELDGALAVDEPGGR
ncbi:hypothetical protein [Streptomyces sp. NBC_01803]|uniref:hypothetical protein n=1 Tax=Streptomyces sp. NBC_01803 TaxID=2975946 RepID=UPI002DD84DE9|nr:hypothetical protein [Streptomyces sp. NBC_01803]WSA45072.1 hypothetical protein OIE51_13150 [Streptomyces sp. NBC_01803]